MPGKRSSGSGSFERARDKPMTRAERAAVNKQFAKDRAAARKRKAVEKARRALKENKAQEAGFAGNVGNFVDTVTKDAKNLAVGTVREGVSSAVAAANLLSPVSSTEDRKKALGYFGNLGVGVARGVEDIIPNPKSLPFGDVSLVQWDGSWKPRFWVKGGESDDSARAAQAWSERPVTSAITALGVVAPAASAGSISRIASAIRKVDPSIGKATALKMARREARNPGYLGVQYGDRMAAAGVQPRVLRSKVGDTTLTTVEVPQSRSPLGRGAQSIADSISRSLPEGRTVWSERKRANRAIQKKIDAEQKRVNADLHTRMAPVREVGYSRTGRPSKPEQALMTYTLQTPEGVSPAQAAAAVRSDLQGILKDGGFEVNGKFRGLSKHERSLVEKQVEGLTKVLDNPPDEATLAAAVEALEGLAQASENIGKHIALQQVRTARRSQLLNIPDEELAAKIAAGFDARRNMLAERLGMEGEARAFFPHSSTAEATVGSFGGATRRPAVGGTLGVPKAPSLRGPNELILYRTGQMSVDPASLMSTYLRRLKFLWTENQRRDLYNEGLPISEVAAAKAGRGYFVRNPDAPPTRLRPEQQLLLDPDNAAAVVEDALSWDSRVTADFYGALKEWQQSAIRPDSDGFDALPDEWKNDIENVRWLPKDVVETRIKHVFSEKPNGWLAPTVGTLNSLARLATIQGKPVRYALSNTAQNVIMAALTNPSALPRALGNQAGLLRSIPKVDRLWNAMRLPQALRSRRPDLYELAVVETGDIAATAGLPEFYVRARSKPQKVEHAITGAQHGLGQALGTAADTPYRLAVWQKHARAYGFVDDADLERLLKSNDPKVVAVREQIRQRTRDDMLDFDRLSPFERENVSRFFFIWPFVRAGFRYPATFVRDYPVRAGAAAAATSQQDYVGDVPVSVRDLFKIRTPGGGEFDAGFLAPMGPALEQASNAGQMAHNLGAWFQGERLNASAVGDMLAPWLQDVGSSAFGSGPTLDDFVRSTVPGYAGTADIVREGVSGVPTVKRFTPKYGDAKLSRSTAKRKREDKTALGKAWASAASRGAALPDPADAVRSFDSWWLYQEYQRRATWGAKESGRSKLTDKEKSLILNRVARETWPSLPITDDERIKKETDPALLANYVSWLYDEMFGARRNVLAADDD